MGCVANGKCAIAVGGVRPELGTCSALSVGRVPRSLTLGRVRGGVFKLVRCLVLLLVCAVLYVIILTTSFMSSPECAHLSLTFV